MKEIERRDKRAGREIEEEFEGYKEKAEQERRKMEKGKGRNGGEDKEIGEEGKGIGG